MRAIIARERAAGIDGLAPGEMPYPHAAENDVIVRVHAAGFTPGELDWPSTWTDRAGRDRTPTIPGHEVSGVVVELGYGTTGLTIGQRVFGVTDWARNGTLAEFVAVEARNLAPLSATVDHITAAALPISGLTAWQGLFTHGQLEAGQTVLIHGAAGGVGSVAVQLAREAGARVIGTGRATSRDTVLGLGAEGFVDLDRDRLEGIGDSRYGLRCHRGSNPLPISGVGPFGRCARQHRRTAAKPARKHPGRLFRGRARSCGAHRVGAQA